MVTFIFLQSYTMEGVKSTRCAFSPVLPYVALKHNILVIKYMKVLITFSMKVYHINIVVSSCVILPQHIILLGFLNFHALLFTGEW